MFGEDFESRTSPRTDSVCFSEPLAQPLDDCVDVSLRFFRFIAMKEKAEVLKMDLQNNKRASVCESLNPLGFRQSRWSSKLCQRSRG